MVFRSRTLSELVTASWGWSLIALFATLVGAAGVYWNHPFYAGGKHEYTWFQEFLPLICAGAVWLVLVVLIAVSASRYRRSRSLPVGDVQELKVADLFLTFLALFFTLPGLGLGGKGIATFINLCLLVLCLLHLSIVWLSTRRFQASAALSGIAVAACTMTLWL